jgi:hypothetical protein
MTPPKEFRKATLNDHPQRAELERWPWRCKFMRLHGVTGSGKTWACWGRFLDIQSAQGQGCLLREHIKIRSLPEYQERGAPWYQAQDGFFHPDVLPKYKGALILDDLSACQFTEAWGRHLHHLIDERWANHRPTLITMACTVRDIGDRYGRAALESRLNAFTAVSLPAVDRRSAK